MLIQSYEYNTDCRETEDDDDDNNSNDDGIAGKVSSSLNTIDSVTLMVLYTEG